MNAYAETSAISRSCHLPQTLRTFTHRSGELTWPGPPSSILAARPQTKTARNSALHRDSNTATRQSSTFTPPPSSHSTDHRPKACATQRSRTATTSAPTGPSLCKTTLPSVTLPPPGATQSASMHPAAGSKPASQPRSTTPTPTRIHQLAGSSLRPRSTKVGRHFGFSTSSMRRFGIRRSSVVSATSASSRASCAPRQK